MNSESSNGRLSNDAESDLSRLQRRLAEARESLHDDAEELVDSANQLGDWRAYVRRYPLASAAVAAAIGFAIVPGKRIVYSPDAKTIMSLARRNKLVVKASDQAEANRGVWGTLLTLAATAAVRGATAYAAAQVGRSSESKPT